MLQEWINERERERERERENNHLFGRECETNNKIIQKKMSRKIFKSKCIVVNTKLSKSCYVIE